VSSEIFEADTDWMDGGRVNTGVAVLDVIVSDLGGRLSSRGRDVNFLLSSILGKR